MFITHYLYRNFGRWAITTLLCWWLLVPFCAAQVLQDHTQQNQPPAPSQTSKKKTKRGPRALAVVEFLPGGKARLVPIALWIDDHFYDASLYGANPEPMAVEPETVYEAYDYGQPTGLFTVTTPEEVKGSWVAMGNWKPHLTMDETATQQKANQPKPKPKAFDVNSERPVLRRGDSNGSTASSSQSGVAGSTTNQQTTGSIPTAPAPSEPPDRPVLKKPTSEAEPAATSSASAADGGSSSAAPSPDERDPNRPILRRGNQQATSAEPAPNATDKMTSQMQSAQGKLMNTIATLGHRSYPAISDAGSYESRPLLYSMDSMERANKADQMRALALEEIGKFVAQRKTPALPKNATLADYELRAFDLDFSNSPTLVLTATLPVTGAKALRGGDFEYFVTVVAHEDVNGTPIKIFSLVSDSNHLDAFPRMQIIDAVDADANGRGDLLFRQYSDSGISYSLYRVYPYDMQKVFEGGASM